MEHTMRRGGDWTIPYYVRNVPPVGDIVIAIVERQMNLLLPQEAHVQVSLAYICAYSIGM